jgi:hypothetical protein
MLEIGVLVKVIDELFIRFVEFVVDIVFVVNMILDE